MMDMSSLQKRNNHVLTVCRFEIGPVRTVVMKHPQGIEWDEKMKGHIFSK